MGSTTQQDAVQAYTEALIEAINDGRLDSHLLDIGRAAYKRAESLGMVQRKRTPSKPKGKKLTSAPKEAERSVDQTPMKADGFPLTPVAEDPDEKQISVGGLFYRRADLINKEFTIRPGTYRDDKWDGRRVKITGCGPKSLKVKYLGDGAAPTGPSGLKDGSVVFLWLDRVGYLFGGAK